MKLRFLLAARSYSPPPFRSKSKVYSAMAHLYKSVEEQQKSVYFGHESLNRISFMREESDFVTSAVLHDSAKFVFFKETNPLVLKNSDRKLVVLDNRLLRKQANWILVLTSWAADNANHDPTVRDGNKPTVLFMGIEDESVGLDLQNLKAQEDEGEQFLDYQGRYQGVPYFAVDVTASKELEQTVVDAAYAATNAEPDTIFFSYSRKHFFGFDDQEGALFSHGKQFLDWLDRNRFCPGCGHKVIPIHAGGKLRCTNPVEEGHESCPVKAAPVSNVSFPRTDAVIITAITDKDRTKMLLSLSKRYAELKMYSCTAGFMEPAELVEVATTREIWEETGVVCRKINMVLTQPWPFPANLMIGCVAEVDFNGVNETINLGHDKELADARWFDMDFVRQLIYERKTVSNPEGIKLPNPESIAFLLIRMVVDQASGSKL